MRVAKGTMNIIGQILRYLAIACLLFVALFPYFWMISTSFKPMAEYFAHPLRWLPKDWTLQHYKDVLNGTFVKSFANSLKVSLSVTLVSIVLSLSASHTFARGKFPGKNAFMLMILGIQFLPMVVFISPLYFVMQRFDLVDTLWAIGIADIVLVLPLSVWMLTGYFRNIPVELEEAAAIDGCSRLGVLFRVAFPVALPGVAATAIFGFITTWQEYMLASIFSSSVASRTVPVALAYFEGEMFVDYGGLMGASTLMSLPVVLLFIMFNRQFQKGLVAGAVKG